MTGLREIHHGHWEGLTRQEVETRFAVDYAAWEEDPFTFAPEGGESGSLGPGARSTGPSRDRRSPRRPERARSLS